MKKTRSIFPHSRFGQILWSLAITLLVGFAYFYVCLPAINLKDPEFYTFAGLLCVVFMVCSLITSGFRVAATEQATPKNLFRDFVQGLKQQCLPVLLLFVALVLIALVGEVLSLPIFRASAYQKLLDVQTGDFSPTSPRSPSTRFQRWTVTRPIIWVTARWAP